VSDVGLLGKITEEFKSTAKALKNTLTAAEAKQKPGVMAWIEHQFEKGMRFAGVHLARRYVAGRCVALRPALLAASARGVPEQLEASDLRHRSPVPRRQEPHL
jgi:hypothetical protein